MKTVEENRVNWLPNSIHSSRTGPLDKHPSAETAICARASPQRGEGWPGRLIILSYWCPSSQPAVWPKQDSFLPSHSPDLRSHLLTSVKSIIFKWSLPFREHRHTVTSLLSTSPTELFFRGLACHFSCWHISVFLLFLFLTFWVLSEYAFNLLSGTLRKIVCIIYW